MPLQPSRGMTHVNRPLTNMSVAYMQSETAYAHRNVFASLPVQKQSDRYFVYSKDFWFRSAAAKRAPASESAGTGYELDNTPSYFCDVWAVHHDIPWTQYGNTDDPLNVDEDGTNIVTRNMLIKREQVFVRQYMTAGVWQGFIKAGSPADFQPNVDGAGFWSLATSNPMADIDALKQFVESQTGFVPNKLVLSKDVFYALRNHPMVLDRIKYTQRGVVDLDLLTGLFGVQVVVAGAVQNTAQEGQTANMGFMSANNFLLCYANPTPSLRQPSAGYVFEWVGYPGAGAFGNSVERMEMPLKKATRIELENYFQFAQVGKDLGVLGVSVLR